jgi:hypothetical protein
MQFGLVLPGPKRNVDTSSWGSSSAPVVTQSYGNGVSPGFKETLRQTASSTLDVVMSSYATGVPLYGLRSAGLAQKLIWPFHSPENWFSEPLLQA